MRRRCVIGNRLWSTHIPRFFFIIHDDIDAEDDEGMILSGPEAARKEALKGARALACEQVCKGYLKLNHRIDVADESGRIVLTIPFREAVAVDS